MINRLKRWWIKRKSYSDYVSPLQKMVKSLQTYVEYQQADIEMMKKAIAYKSNEIAYSENSIEKLAEIVPFPEIIKPEIETEE